MLAESQSVEKLRSQTPQKKKRVATPKALPQEQKQAKSQSVEETLLWQCNECGGEGQAKQTIYNHA